MDPVNVTAAPKTATFQMRINPEVKQRVEAIYARQGLTLTDAVNIFIQQSLNSVEQNGWVSEEDAYRLLEADE